MVSEEKQKSLKDFLGFKIQTSTTLLLLSALPRKSEMVLLSQICIHAIFSKGRNIGKHEKVKIGCVSS